MFHISGIFDFANESVNNDLSINAFLNSIYPEENYNKKSFQPTKNLTIWGVERANSNITHYEDSELFIMYSGYILPVDALREQSKEGFKLDIQFLSVLFKKYDSGLTNKIKGSYILIIYSKLKNKLFICNDQFGFLKLYYYSTAKKFYFSTLLSFFNKHEFPKLKVNLSSVMQKIIFNYPVCDNSYINGVKILPAATTIFCYNTKTEINKYWSSLCLMNKPIYNYSNGVDIVHRSLERVLNNYTSIINKFGLSLTGGWDGRLILSYLLKNPTNEFFLYSFGTQQSQDIVIPEMLAEQEGFDYTPIYLDEEYVNNLQYVFSKECILSSSGIRNLNLGHYIYAMSIVGKRTNNILTGNCGSNLLKPLNSTGPIYNDFIKMLFENESLSEGMQKVKNNFCIQNPFFEISNENWDSLFHDLSLIPSLNLTGFRKNQQFYVFLIDVIERMYFGSEIETYLKNVNNYSPFIDFEFLTDISTTPYFGAHHGFFSKKGYLSRYHLSGLYARLVNINTPRLSNYITDRGFTLNDMISLNGQAKVFLNRIRNKILKINRGHSLVFDYASNFRTMDCHQSSDEFQLIRENHLEKETLLNFKSIQNYKSFLVWYNSL